MWPKNMLQKKYDKEANNLLHFTINFPETKYVMVIFIIQISICMIKGCVEIFRNKIKNIKVVADIVLFFALF